MRLAPLGVLDDLEYGVYLLAPALTTLVFFVELESYETPQLFGGEPHPERLDERFCLRTGQVHALPP